MTAQAQTLDAPAVDDTPDATKSAPGVADTDAGSLEVEAPAKKKAATRTYVVLSIDKETKALAEAGRYVASGDKGAATLAATEHGVGDYIVVAESSWHLRTVESEAVDPKLVVK